MISGAVGPGDHDSETSSIWFVSILGGKPRRLRGGAYKATLSPDNSLVAYMSLESIMLADADGENPREFIGTGAWEFVGSPVWSSDGKRIIYRHLAPSGGGLVATIESRGLDEESSTELVRGDGVGKYDLIWSKNFLMLDDRLVFAKDEPEPRKRDENLWELAVDPDSGKPRGEPRRLTDWVGFTFIDLSATADGSQLVFGNDRTQMDVYIGELGDGGRSLDNTSRLTLDDRDDAPWCWTPDSRAVVFQSDRYGNADLLVQDLDERNARDLVLGAGNQFGAHLTPDGRSFLYWESEEADGWVGPRRLLRIPVGGGPTERVLEAPGFAISRCATTPDGHCVLGEILFPEGVIKFSRLDPVTGRGEELWRKDLNPGTRAKAALSPDGSRFAMVGHTKDAQSIRLVDALSGEVIRDIDVGNLQGLAFDDVEWSSDGNGVYLVGDSARGAALVHVDLQGVVHVLHEAETAQYFTVRASPDGRHLAFGKKNWDTNAWKIEKF